MDIVVVNRGSDFKAHLKDQPGVWEAGATEYAAVNKLMVSLSVIELETVKAALATSRFLHQKTIEDMAKTNSQGWRDRCVIVTNYVPPHPTPGHVPAKVSIYFPATDTFLRYLGSKSPTQAEAKELLWDIHYGDDSDFGTVEAARKAILIAPVPSPACLKFTIPVS